MMVDDVQFTFTGYCKHRQSHRFGYVKRVKTRTTKERRCWHHFIGIVTFITCIVKEYSRCRTDQIIVFLKFARSIEHAQIWYKKKGQVKFAQKMRNFLH